MMNSNNPLARQKGLVVQELPGEVLVYDLDTSKAHCLNQNAAIVWRSCTGTNSVKDIARQFELMGSGGATKDFVWLAIDQLNENGLFEKKVPLHFESRSRRQLLRSIGLASVVALPIL